jgi:N-methylhydantoinase A/oxoprolinase/acetone carboxylase beta subunit
MMVNLRLSALGRLENRLSLGASFSDNDKGERGKRPVIFDDGHPAIASPIYLRTGLKSGDRIEGPAVIEESGATILLYPNDKMQVNEWDHLVIDIGR